MSVQSDLDHSMNDEMSASLVYRKRAESARMAGDEASAKLWIHIAEEEDGHYNEFKDRLNALREVPGWEQRIQYQLGHRHPSQVTASQEEYEKPMPLPSSWVYVKVGVTEVRGRRVPSGIEIEQVSPIYDRTDFDRAVESIKEKLKGVEPSFEDYANMESMGHPIGPMHRSFPQTYSEWVSIAEDIKAKVPNDYNLVDSINDALNRIRTDEPTASSAQRFLLDKADEYGVK